MDSPKAIVLVSGGVDSLLTLALAHQRYSRKHPPLAPSLALLHASYGQRTEKKERECFEHIAQFYQIPPELRRVVDLSYLRQIGGSALTDPRIPLRKSTKAPEGPLSEEEIPNSYVPFRNTHLLALATSWAEVLGAQEIYIGAVWEDSSGYPDCRPSYFRAYNDLLKEGTRRGDLQVLAPVIHLKKSQIIQQALSLGAPLELTWSCYAAQDRSCGQCDSCLLRLQGFQSLGMQDPLPYKEGL